MYADNLWANCKLMLITSATVILLSSPAATFAASCPDGCLEKTSESECNSGSCNFTCDNKDVKCMWQLNTALTAGGECIPSDSADCN